MPGSCFLHRLRGRRTAESLLQFPTIPFHIVSPLPFEGWINQLTKKKKNNVLHACDDRRIKWRYLQHWCLWCRVNFGVFSAEIFLSLRDELSYLWFPMEIHSVGVTNAVGQTLRNMHAVVLHTSHPGREILRPWWLPWNDLNKTVSLQTFAKEQKQHKI